MKVKLCILLLVALNHPYVQSSQNYRLWYDKPAFNWNSALPVGNGRLAAIIFGILESERLQLNEETMWAGEPDNNIIETVKIKPKLGVIAEYGYMIK